MDHQHMTATMVVGADHGASGRSVDHHAPVVLAPGVVSGASHQPVEPGAPGSSSSSSSGGSAAANAISGPSLQGASRVRPTARRRSDNSGDVAGEQETTQETAQEKVGEGPTELQTRSGLNPSAAEFNPLPRSGLNPSAAIRTAVQQVSPSEHQREHQV